MPRWRSNPSLLIGAAISLTMICVAVFAPWITRWPVDQMDMAHRLAWPTTLHWLGTDNFGRDLWTRIALGARIQLGFFAWERRDGVEQRVLVRRGFYRFIRHPVYAGIYLALIAWPVAYGAPISGVLTIVIVAIVMNRLIKEEEETLVARYGDEYRQYKEESDAMIPNLW